MPRRTAQPYGRRRPHGGSYQTITAFIANLFADGGDGILQFQDGTPALTSAQWTELDAALAKAPNPAPVSPPASSPPSPQASSPTPDSRPAGERHCAAAAVPGAAGQATGTERGPALRRAGHGSPSGTAGGEQ